MSNILKELFSPGQKYDDKEVYEMITRGENLGCFQIESGLLRSYSKKLKPTNLNQLADLISLVRPGTLEAIDTVTGDNMAIVYCKRKNGETPIRYIHKSLEPILKNTQGVLIYQEQAMEIAKQIGGFNLQEADDLRRAAGKKKPEEMAKVKIKFLEGCKKVGKVNEKEADDIWSWIEKSQRYSFNASHATAYAVMAYATAYLKCKHRKEFYISWLRKAKDKMNPFEEIKNLVNEAKINGFDVTTPKLYLKNEEFEAHNNSISFGLSDIRGISSSTFSKMKLTFSSLEAIIGNTKNWSWDTFILNTLDQVGYGTIKSLICSGALDYMMVDRQRMLYEYGSYKESLTEKDVEYLKTLSIPILEGIKSIKPDTKINNRKIPEKKYNNFKSLISILENPPFSLKDTSDFIAFNEELYLGTAISCSKVYSCDISSANCSVIDLVRGNVGDYICIGCVIESVRPFTIKKGKNKGTEMAFLNISDSGASMDSVVAFVEVYKEFKNLLINQNTTLLRGKYQKEKKSFVIEKVWQL